MSDNKGGSNVITSTLAVFAFGLSAWTAYSQQKNVQDEAIRVILMKREERQEALRAERRKESKAYLEAVILAARSAWLASNEDRHNNNLPGWAKKSKEKFELAARNLETVAYAKVVVLSSRTENSLKILLDTMKIRYSRNPDYPKVEVAFLDFRAKSQEEFKNNTFGIPEPVAPLK